VDLAVLRVKAGAPLGRQAGRKATSKHGDVTADGDLYQEGEISLFVGARPGRINTADVEDRGVDGGGGGGGFVVEMLV